MTRYDDMDESGGGISVSGHAPGPPRPAHNDSHGDTDWELALYGPGPARGPEEARGGGAPAGGR